MKVYFLLLVLYLVFLPLNCFASYNPSDAIHDTIEQEKNEVMNDFRYKANKTYDEVMGKIKSGIKTLLVWAVETGTVIAIGWCFTFLVDKSTAKMIKLIILICAITEIIKFLVKIVNFVNT